MIIKSVFVKIFISKNFWSKLKKEYLKFYISKTIHFKIDLNRVTLPFKLCFISYKVRLCLIVYVYGALKF